MNLNEAFKELDNLYESTTYIDRDTLIAEIRNFGYNYKFEKYDDRQLYNIWLWAKKKAHTNRIAKKINNDFEKARNIKYCNICGTQISDNGECSRCSDYGWEEI